MSILTSPAEQNAARARLAGLPTEQLERDLAYWATAKGTHHHRWQVATEQAQQARDLYLEADFYGDAIGDELALRKRAEERP